jgi:hypothetical protein
MEEVRNRKHSRTQNPTFLSEGSATPTRGERALEEQEAVAVAPAGFCTATVRVLERKPAVEGARATSVNRKGEM